MTEHRKDIRLPHYDYRTNGAYFVTACTHLRHFLFGDIEAGAMIRTPLGEIVESEWKDLPRHYEYVMCDTAVVMPNHFHGIIILFGAEDTASCVATRRFGEIQAGSLLAIIRSFKAGVTRRARIELRNIEQVWQPNFYEHVIRNDDDLSNIRKYIQENPMKWELDKENPANIKNV